MTVVVGTAGHIDHGKTTLLRALTGIDADRLPEERRRGMTIDIGYAHLDLDDGTAIDFVDVPGHDRLVGNMLVGAGEIDAALLVVAADDGPRAQTLEHLGLLDALAINPGIVAVTKSDAVEPGRVEAVVREVQLLLTATSLAGSPVVVVSATTGAGLDELRASIVALARRMAPTVERPPTLAIDRAFSIKGRGVVVTGSLRGGPVRTGATLRVVPSDGHETGSVRVREMQVHGGLVDQVTGGGRVALNLAGPGAAGLHRGTVLTLDPTIVATDRALVAFSASMADRARGRIHVGTAATDAAVGRSGRDALVLPDGRAAGIVRLSTAVAMRPGDRFVLRRGPDRAPIGGVVLDTTPPRGISRRRQSPERVAALAAGGVAARLDLHGALIVGQRVELARDVDERAADAVVAAVEAKGGMRSVAEARDAAATTLRRTVTLRRDQAAVASGVVVARLVDDDSLQRDADVVRLPGASAPILDPTTAAAMDRLEEALSTATPPALAEAAIRAGCPADAVRALERSGRIVVLDADLAFAAATYQELAATAVRSAAEGPLTPAAYRDAIGSSRKYVMAILEDLDRRGVLRRTPAGHLPGPRPNALADPGATSTVR